MNPQDLMSGLLSQLNWARGGRLKILNPNQCEEKQNCRKLSKLSFNYWKNKNLFGPEASSENPITKYIGICEIVMTRIEEKSSKLWHLLFSHRISPWICFSTSRCEVIYNEFQNMSSFQDRYKLKATNKFFGFRNWIERKNISSTMGGQVIYLKARFYEEWLLIYSFNP